MAMNAGGLSAGRRSFHRLLLVMRQVGAYRHAEDLLLWDRMVHVRKPLRQKARAAAVTAMQFGPSELFQRPELVQSLEAAEAWVREASNEDFVPGSMTKPPPSPEQLVDAFPLDTLSSLKVEEVVDGGKPLHHAVVRACVEEVRRAYDIASRVATRVEESSTLAKSVHAWQGFRSQNDWTNFIPFFRNSLSNKRDLAEMLMYRRQDVVPTPFDALMDISDRGLRSKHVEAVVTDLKSWLPSLAVEAIKKSNESRKKNPVVEPIGPFKQDQQLSLGKALLDFWQVNREPSCNNPMDPNYDPSFRVVSDVGAVPPECFPLSRRDTRITVAARPSNAFASIDDVMRMVGKALYHPDVALEAKILSHPPGTFAIEAVQMLFQFHLGKSKGFAEAVEPLLRTHYPIKRGDLGKASSTNNIAFTKDNLWRKFTTAKPTLLRIDADELTLPLHLMVRADMEHALMNDNIDLGELPTAWNFKMKEYLNVTSKDVNNGCMQEHSWAAGEFGQFPMDLLALVASAQLRKAMEKDLGGSGMIDNLIAQGYVQPIINWLETKMFQLGRRLPTSTDILTHATKTVLPVGTGHELTVDAIQGTVFSTDAYKDYLVKKYIDSP